MQQRFFDFREMLLMVGHFLIIDSKERVGSQLVKFIPVLFEKLNIGDNLGRQAV